MHGTLYAGEKVYRVNQKGEITYENGKGGWAIPSGQWRIRGAVRFNNFGNIVEIMPFAAFHTLNGALDGKGWKYANGKQKWHVQDYDHGTVRVWMCPAHYGIFYPDQD